MAVTFQCSTLPQSCQHGVKVSSVSPAWALWRRQVKDYLDYLEFYGIAGHVLRCATFWVERRNLETGELSLSPIGCGDVVACPRCAEHDAKRMIDPALSLLVSLWESAGERGIEPYVVVFHFTLPKDVSQSVDEWLWTDLAKWERVIDGLFKASRKVVERIFGKAKIGGVQVFHPIGDVAPWEAHYHFIVILFPLLYDGEAWRGLAKWVEVEELERLRREWTKEAKRVLEGVGVKVEASEFVVHRQYCGRIEKAIHSLRYELRPMALALWKSVKRDGDGWIYEFAENGRRRCLRLKLEQFRLVLERLWRIRGSRIRRVRWFGYLACRARSTWLPQLGLQRKKVKRAWVRTKRVWELRKLDVEAKFAWLQWRNLIVAWPLSSLSSCPVGLGGRGAIWTRSPPES